MQWTVVGPGAMGCLWAHYLDALDAKKPLNQRLPLSRVQLVGRNINRKRIIELRKSGINGCHDRSLTLSGFQELELPLQQVLISTKAYDTCQAFTSLAPYINETSQVVLLCNGIQVQQQLAKRYPNHKLYALVTAVGAYLTAPFNVVHAGLGDSYVGPLTASAQANPITEFPLATKWDLQIQQRMVDKLSVNAVINPLTAIHQCANGDLLKGPLFDEFQRLALEVETLLAAQGLYCSKSVLALATLVAEKTAQNYSSSYHDVYHQRKTELQAFTGFLYEVSLKHQIKAPEHTKLMRTFRQLKIQFIE